MYSCTSVQSRGRAFRTLQEGQKVSFKVVQGQKGLQADEVAPA
jgi:CspA family cold shock protein